VISDNVRARAALWHMRHLERGWDSYDACTIADSAIQKALALLNFLPGEWQAVPVSDGSVQLEQHCDGLDVEISITAHLNSEVSR
jgi:hypothetical protein